MAFSNENTLLDALLLYEERHAALCTELYQHRYSHRILTLLLSSSRNWPPRFTKAWVRLSLSVCAHMKRRDEAIYAMRDEVYGVTKKHVSFNTLSQYIQCWCCKGQHVTCFAAAALYGMALNAHKALDPSGTTRMRERVL